MPHSLSHALPTEPRRGQQRGRQAMDGYAFPGQPPVYPGRTIPTKVVPLHVRAEAYGDVAAEAELEIVRADLEGNAEVLAEVYDTAGVVETTRPLDKLLADLDAANIDDWLRLFAVCPVADQPIAALNFQTWLTSTMCGASWVKRQADEVAARRLKL